MVPSISKNTIRVQEGHAEAEECIVNECTNTEDEIQKELRSLLPQGPGPATAAPRAVSNEPTETKS